MSSLSAQILFKVSYNPAPHWVLCSHTRPRVCHSDTHSTRLSTSCLVPLQFRTPPPLPPPHPLPGPAAARGSFQNANVSDSFLCLQPCQLSSFLKMKAKSWYRFLEDPIPPSLPALFLGMPGLLACSRFLQGAMSPPLPGPSRVCSLCQVDPPHPWPCPRPFSDEHLLIPPIKT